MRRASEPYSIRWFVGKPKSGKTTLALIESVRLSRESGNPLLVIDSDHVPQLSGVPHVASVDQAIQRVWGDRATCAYTPTDIGPRGYREVAALCRAVLEGKDVCLLIDEAHNWLVAQSGSSADLVSLMRKAQHARMHALLSTQHLTGDVPQAARTCTDHAYIFRNDSEPVLKTLAKPPFEIPPRVVLALPQFGFVHRAFGF